MDLWIRSQDRLTFKKVRDVYMEKDYGNMLHYTVYHYKGVKDEQIKNDN